MTKTKDIIVVLDAEEHALLLDAVISTLGNYQVKLFHARAPVLQATLAKRCQQMGSILKKLLTVLREDARAHADGVDDNTALRGKAA